MSTILQVFCYGEDDYGNQMYSQSAPVTFHTKATRCEWQNNSISAST